MYNNVSNRKMNTFICFKITQPFEEGKTSIPHMTTFKLPPILRFFYTIQNFKLENDLMIAICVVILHRRLRGRGGGGFTYPHTLKPLILPL